MTPDAVDTASRWRINPARAYSVRSDGSLVITGGTTRRVIKAQLTPFLLPILEAEPDDDMPSDLSTRLGMDHAVVARGLAILSTLGVVTGSKSTAPTSIPGWVHQRFIEEDSCRFGSDGDVVVTVGGPEPWRAALESELRALGIIVLDRYQPHHDPATETISVLSYDTDRTAGRSGRSLWVGATARGAAVGPWTDGSANDLCARCARQSLGEGRSNELGEQAALVAAEIEQLTVFRRALGSRRARVLDLEVLATSEVSVLADRQCPRCVQFGQVSDPVVEWLRFEQLVGPSRDRAHQPVSITVGDRALEEDRRELEPLSALDARANADPGAGCESLLEVLREVFGCDSLGHYSLPTAGNLRSVKPYVVSPDGTRAAFFDGQSGRLLPLRQDLWPQGPDGCLHPDSLILLTSQRERLTNKYGDLGVRLSDLDIGTALAMVSVLAARANLRARLVEIDTIAAVLRALDLDPRRDLPRIAVAFDPVTTGPGDQRPASASPFADIQARRSVRQYSDEPLDLTRLARASSAAVERFEQLWSHPFSPTPSLVVFPYRCNEVDRRIRRLIDGKWLAAPPLGQAPPTHEFLPGDIVDPAAVLFIEVDLSGARSASATPGHAYPYLLWRGASLMTLVWLAGLSEGIESVPLGPSLDWVAQSTYQVVEPATRNGYLLFGAALGMRQR